MEKSMQILNLLSQRRVWVAIISGVSFLISFLHMEFQVDVPVLSDLFTTAGIAIFNLVTAVLAIWSYLQPKPENKNEQSN